MVEPRIPSPGAAAGAGGVRLAGAGNRLLAALPRDEFERLRPDLEEAALARGAVLLEAGAPIERVWFPHDCAASYVLALEDGGMAETGTVGHEGLVGLGAASPGGLAVGGCVVQVPGRAAALPATRLRRALAEGPGLRRLLDAYALAFAAQLMRSVACNARHPVEQRLARWLLMCLDRAPPAEAGASRLPLTHEFLAGMLGVARPTVTLAARRLQAAGLLQLARGAIEVLDRPGLEEASCECYRALREVTAHLLPHTYG
jgi:CRP-like cAMP-binding protein